MKKLLLLLCSFMLMLASRSQNITTAEYFVDTDPGAGNGTVILGIVAGDIVNFSATVSSASFSNGFHLLAIRVKNINGTWSLFERRGFYVSGAVTGMPNITAAEYFFDNDPGIGNGTVLSVGTPGAVVNFSPVIPQSLATGFHFLAIRVKDANGNWSLFERRGFYASGTTPDLPIISAAEYFYDTDPGRGNGTPLTVTTPGNIITQTFNVPVSRTITLGQHFLGIYVRDLSNNWSLFAYDTLSVEIKAPADVVVNTAPGQCSQVVNNIDASLFVVQPFTYSLSGATTGSGSGNVSGLSFNKGITTVTYIITAFPTAFSSFTVTVTDNENPTISCPSNITGNTDAGICAAVVSYSLPTFNDNCPGSTIARTAGPASGSSFPKGITTVTHQVTDAAGNTVSCSFTVTVVDAENPTINCPADIVTTNPVVNYSLPTFNDNCGGTTISQSAGLPSGSTFPLGVTKNTFIVTDAAGNTATCSFNVTVNASLPVHLISFTASKTTDNKVLLQWITENEVNNSHFEIERSENGRDYVMIGRVNASTSSSDPKEYSFTDAQPFKGANYYRLRQEDRDGRFEYTPVRRIVFSQVGDRLNIYPNPANDYVQFDYTGKQKTIFISVFDAVGRQVLSWSLANQVPLKINISKLSNGQYFVQLSDGETISTGSFIKQ